MHESEDLRLGFSRLRVITEACLSQKNGCGVYDGRRSLFDFLEEFTMKNKKMLLAVGALVLVVAVMMGVFLATRPEVQVGGKEITVTVVHGDGASKDFVYKTDAEFLGEVIMAEGLVEGEAGPYGLMINAVDGEAASWEVNQSYWSILIGEEYATLGADSIPVEDGGVYSLVYTIG